MDTPKLLFFEVRLGCRVDEEVMTAPQSLIINLVTYGASNLGIVSTVAAHRNISDTQQDLRAVSE